VWKPWRPANIPICGSRLVERRNSGPQCPALRRARNTGDGRKRNAHGPRSRASTLKRTFDVIVSERFRGRHKAASRPPMRSRVTRARCAAGASKRAIRAALDSSDACQRGIRTSEARTRLSRLRQKSLPRPLAAVAVAPAHGSNDHVIGSSLLSAAARGQAGAGARQVTKVTSGVQGHNFFHLRGRKTAKSGAGVGLGRHLGFDAGRASADLRRHPATDVDLWHGYKITRSG